MSIAPVPAILALADGTVFHGHAIGAPAPHAGEVVFNTAMTGYQEILTDPSYAGQIVTLTYPHIGNTGVNAEDVESRQIHAAGLVIRDLPRLASNLRSTQDLSSYLRDAGVAGHLRHRHAQAHAHPAREGRAERLPHGRCRRCAGSAAPVRAPHRRWPGSISPRSVSCSAAVRLDRQHLGARRRLPAAGGRRTSTWSPTITASSTTSCACSPSAAAALPWCRRRRRRTEVLALRARRHLPVQRPGRSGTLRLRHRRHPALSRTRAFRPSASASATSCWVSRRAARR